MSRGIADTYQYDKNPPSVFLIQRSGPPTRLSGASSISTAGRHIDLTDYKHSSKTHYGKDSRSLYSPIGEKFTDHTEDEKTVQRRRIRELELNIASLEISSRTKNSECNELKERNKFLTRFYEEALKNEKVDEDNFHYLERNIQGRDDMLEEILEKNKSLIHEVERLKIVIKQAEGYPHQSRDVEKDVKSIYLDNHSTSTKGTSYSSRRPNDSYLNDLISENENLKTELKHLTDKNENSLKKLGDAKREYGVIIEELNSKHEIEINQLDDKCKRYRREAETNIRKYQDCVIEVNDLKKQCTQSQYTLPGSIKEQCCEHISEIKDLKVKLQSVENEAVTQDRIYANLNIEVNALRNEHKQLKDVFEDYQRESCRLNEIITTNREEIRDLKGKLIIIREEADSRGAHHASLTTGVSTLQFENDRLKALIEDKERESLQLKETITNYNSEIRDLNGMLRSIQDEADSRGSHHASLTIEVSTLQIENNHLKEMIEDSRKSNIMINEQIAQLKSMRERDRHPEDRDLQGMSYMPSHDGAGDASVKIEWAMEEIDSLKKECSQLKLENKRPQSNTDDFHPSSSFEGQTTEELNDLRKECDRLKALLNVKSEEMTKNPHQLRDVGKDGKSRDNHSSNTTGTIYLIKRPNESNLNDLISANENLKNELKHLADKNENLMKNLGDAKHEYGVIIAELESKHEGEKHQLEDKCKRYRREAETHIRKHQDFDSEVNDLRKLCAQSKCNISDKEKESRQLNETITTYRKEVKDLNGKLNVIQGEADSRGTHNASLTTEVSTLQMENNRLKEMIEEAMSRHKYEKAAENDWHLLERHMEVWKTTDASSVVKEYIRSSKLQHPNFTNKKRDDVLEETLEKNKSLSHEVERLKIVIEKAGDLKTE